VSNVIGFDDGPFTREHRGDVPLVGVVCARTRPDGVLISRVRRDGVNATERMAELVCDSPFSHVQAVLLQGIAVAGFNVVDIHGLAERIERPVLVVCRRRPDLGAIRRALARIAGGDKKWQLVERAGEVEPLEGLFVQRAGLTTARARELLRATTLHGKLPEPLRLAHVIAGAIVTGVGRGGA
jgi:hypothetical protein